MTVYHVDPNEGLDTNSGTSITIPWKTADKVNSAAFLPDDVIAFKCDTIVPLPNMLVIPSSGIDGHPIIVSSYGAGAKPRLDGLGKQACIYDSKSRGFITIEALEIANATYSGIRHDHWDSTGHELDTPNWTVRNCRFPNTSITMWGRNMLIEDNEFAGVQPTTSPPSAIHLRGAVTKNSKVLRNKISGYFGRGVWCMNVDTPTVNDNVIHDISQYVGEWMESYGINFDGFGYPVTGFITCEGNEIYNTVQYGIFFENGSEGSRVRGNLIHDIGHAGIWERTYEACARYPDQRGNDVDGEISYNIVYNCNIGVWLYELRNVRVWNNVLMNGNGEYPKGLALRDSLGTYVDNIDFRNNIVKGWSYAIACTHHPKTWKGYFSHCDFNAVQSAVIEEIGAHWYSLSQIQADMPSSFSEDPLFVDEVGHDYHLKEYSPCIFTGVDVGLTEDFDGVGVTAPPDIGAFQFESEVGMSVTVNLTGISSGNGTGDPVTITAVADKPLLFAGIVVNYVNPATVGSIVLTPKLDAEGVAIITVTVKNSQATKNTTIKTFKATLVKLGVPAIDDIADVTVYS